MYMEMGRRGGNFTCCYNIGGDLKISTDALAGSKANGTGL